MNAGERAIAKEQRRQEKERRKRIELANKMLIPVGKKTTESLGILSFDPSGVLRLLDNRWIKMYRLEGELFKLVDVLSSLNGRIRITWHKNGMGGKVSCHLSLIENGEIYEEIRQKIAEDESKIMESVRIRGLSIDEAMSDIALGFRKDLRFSYASFVRGNKDWKKELYLDVKEELDQVNSGKLYGESFSVLQFPKEADSIFAAFESLYCETYIGLDLNSLTEEENSDYKRAMEKKYNVRLPVGITDDFINLSLSILFFIDSDDARKIVEETILTMMAGKGFVLTPNFHKQRKVMEGILDMGITDQKIIRNVDRNFAYELLGGGSGASTEVEV